MRSKKYLLSFTVGLLLSIPAFAQSSRVSLNLRGSSIKEFFAAIEKQSSYKFSYRDAEIETAEPVSIEVKNATISEVLGSILPKSGLQYTVVGSSIVITPFEEAPQAAVSKVVLSGRVLDKNGEPLPGAGVVVKGSNQGTVTDLDGAFSIEVQKNQIVLFSALAYNEKQVRAVRSLKGMEVVLEDDYESISVR